MAEVVVDNSQTIDTELQQLKASLQPVGTTKMGTAQALTCQITQN